MTVSGPYRSSISVVQWWAVTDAGRHRPSSGHADHHHLQPIEQLGDLSPSDSSDSCSAASHTSPASSMIFFPSVHAGVERGDGAAARRSGTGLFAQLGEQFVEGFHGCPSSHVTGERPNRFPRRRFPLSPARRSNPQGSRAHRVSNRVVCRGEWLSSTTRWIVCPSAVGCGDRHPS